MTLRIELPDDFEMKKMMRLSSGLIVRLDNTDIL